MAFHPLIPIYAQAVDPIISGRDQGRAFLNENSSQFAFPSGTGNGSQISMPDGTSVSFADLFQTQEQDSTPQNFYELSDAEFIQEGLNARQRLQTGNNVENQAFRTLRESVGQKSQVNFEDDPMWGSTDAVFDFLDGKEVDCSTVGPTTPDYRECNRINTNPQYCLIDHEINLIPHDMDLVFVIDNSSSMGGVIHSIMQQTAALVETMTQNQQVGSFRVGGVASRHFTSNFVNIGPPENFYSWISSIGGTSGSAMTAATNHVVNNFAWRSDPTVAKLVIVIGNKDGAGGNPSTVAALAESKGIDVFVFHDNASVHNLGTWRANQYSNESFYELLKNYVDVEDRWSPQDCIDKAFEPISEFCYRSITPLSGGSGSCQEIGGFNVCPGDPIYNQISESPVPGLDRLTILGQISEPICNFGDGRENYCSALRDNPQCGFISTQCADGTAAELAEKMFTEGLNRSASASELQLWTSKVEKDGYDLAKEEFHFTFNVTKPDFFQELACIRYVERYDCSGSTGNSGACGIKDLFETDFASCQENTTTEMQTTSYTTRSQETCEEALKLTTCEVSRKVNYYPNTETQRVNVFSCSAEKQTIERQIRWVNDPAYANQSVSYRTPGIEALQIQAPNSSNDWTARYEYSCPGHTAQAPLEGYFNLFTSGYYVTFNDIDDPAESGNDPCLRTSDNFTDTSWVCTEQQTVSYDGNDMAPGARGSILPPLYQGEEVQYQGSTVCTKAVATYQTKDYTSGQFCHINLQGLETCINLTPDQTLNSGENNCAALEQRTAAGQCEYEGRFEIEGASGITGFNYIWEHRYNCNDETFTRTDPVSVSEYVCEGIVRCMGSECVQTNDQKSSDFGRAAAMLAAIQEMGSDITCDVQGDVKTCTVFGGEAQTCKMAMGGWVDCCERVNGISLGDYITMLKTTARFDAYLTGTSVAEPIRGSYSALRDPVVKSYQYLEQGFTSAMDKITGGTTSEIGSIVDGAGAALDGFKQSIMKGANEFLTQQFSPDVASFFFEASAEGGMQLAQGFSTALSVIGAIYTAYVIADILVNIIWECTEEELQLMVDVAMKKTIYIGSYCASEVLGQCIERRKSYCTFSSPLARIINHQGRMQLGQPYGSAKSPNCRGISIEDLSNLDWERIDLSEWMDLLKITSNYPGDSGLDLNALTGANSYLGTLDEEDARLNTADRNIERLQGTDLPDLNEKAQPDLWDKYVR